MATSKKSSKKGSAKKGGGRKGGAASSRAAASGAVPPYGVAIREAAARGDAAEMRRVAASARKWIRDAQAALERLEKRLGQGGGR
ncbi:MAG TPA: DUF1843 domain-containing protein [Pyrinomonadaceae bacterium]|jgi:hypothetical protein